eukprot:472567-Pyramimonas_sp.AAC.1
MAPKVNPAVRPRRMPKYPMWLRRVENGILKNRIKKLWRDLHVEKVTSRVLCNRIIMMRRDIDRFTIASTEAMRADTERAQRAGAAVRAAQDGDSPSEPDADS